MYHHSRPRLSFGTGLTATGKNLLIMYAAIYVLELLLVHWFRLPFVYSLLLWPVNGDGFRFWQIITSHFLHDPGNPLGFLINCLMFYFFAGAAENALGTRRFLIFFYLSALGAVVCGLPFTLMPDFRIPFSGMMPGLLALIVIFGLMNPESTILLMFVIPLKAKYISYATVLITFLTFLAKTNPLGAYHMGGMLVGYIYFRGPGNIPDFSRLHFAYLQWRFEREKKARFRKFRVIEGGKDKDKDDNRPTYH